MADEGRTNIECHPTLARWHKRSKCMAFGFGQLELSSSCSHLLPSVYSTLFIRRNLIKPLHWEMDEGCVILCCSILHACFAGICQDLATVRTSNSRYLKDSVTLFRATMRGENLPNETLLALFLGGSRV